MKPSDPKPAAPAALRQQAEQKWREQQTVMAPGMPECDERALVHELQVHQIELEMQNEELLRARSLADEAGDKYSQLFDFAPVGYFQLAQDGLIHEVNFAGAALLGLDRNEVIGRRLGAFVAPACLQEFDAFSERVLNAANQQTGQVKLLRQGQSPFDVLLEGILANAQGPDGKLWGLAVTDISALKQAEEALRRARAELEMRVAERTAELLHSNERLKQEARERVEAEAELRWSQELLRAVVENSAAAIYVKDAEGRYLLLNPECERLMQVAEEQARGKTDHELMEKKEDADRFHANDLRVLETGQPVTVEETSHLQGARRVCVSVKVPLRDQSGVPWAVCGISTDISERKHMEEALRLNEARFRALTENADMITVIDATGTILYHNPGMAHGLGFAPQELLGHSGFDWVHPEDLGLARQVFENLVNQPGSRIMTELRGHMRDGSWRVLEVIGKNLLGDPAVQGIVLNARDITVRKEVEGALMVSEARLAGIIGSAMDAIITVDAAQRIVLFNPAAEQMFRCSAAAVLGQSLDRFLPPDARAAHSAHIRKFGTTGETMRRMGRLGSIHGRRADGEEFPIEASMSQTDLNGEKLFTVILRDNTDRKRAEESLRQAHDELETQVEERTADLRRAHHTVQMVSECNQVLVKASDEQTLIPAVCQTIVKVGGYVMAWVGLAQADRAKTVRPAAAVGPEHRQLEPMRISWGDNPFGRGPTGTAIRTGRFCLVEDCRRDPRMASWREHVRRYGYRSAIAMPLQSREATFGAITIYATEPNAFDPNQIALLSDLANDLAFGITALRARAERDQAQHALEQKALQLRALAAELVRTEQRERQRFAGILHDDLQQLLYGARCGLDGLRQANESRSDQRMIRRVDALLSRCLETARSLTSEMYPPLPRDAGLAVQLKWLAEWFGETHRLSVKVIADDPGVCGTEEIQIVLFQAARELLFNVVKHARVKRASVRVTRLQGNALGIVVSDKGAGFDLARLKTSLGAGRHFGLFGIQERLALLGGSLELESLPRRGTRVTLRAPLPPLVRRRKGAAAKRPGRKRIAQTPAI